MITLLSDALFRRRLRAGLRRWVDGSPPSEPPFPDGARAGTELPAPVREAIALYERHVLPGDWGVVWAYRAPFRHRVVFVLWVTTDGTDGWLEAYDDRGALLVCGRTQEGAGVSWETRELVRADLEKWAPE